MGTDSMLARRQPDSLADLLERVLDKGVVIAGDIVINVLDIELLTLKVRLFIASAQTAQELGMDWWNRDPFFTSRPTELQDGRRREIDGAGEGRDQDQDQLTSQLRAENEELKRTIEELEASGRDSR